MDIDNVQVVEPEQAESNRNSDAFSNLRKALEHETENSQREIQPGLRKLTNVNKNLGGDFMKTLAHLP